MSKNVKNRNNDCAFVTVIGEVVFSNFVRYDNNRKEIHNYFIQVSENYKDKDGNEKERKYSFKATQFGVKGNSYLFLKGDRVKINGFLKVNSYKNEDNEWINQTYIQINKIDYVE